MLECVEEGREEKSESEIINSEIELTHTTTTVRSSYHSEIELTHTTTTITIITTTITITTFIITPNRRYQQPTTTPTPPSPSSPNPTSLLLCLLLRNDVVRPMRIVVCSSPEHILQTVR
jgi:hypothetical protein